MDSYHTLATLAIILGVGWASGINLYGAVVVLGLAAAAGYTTLPPGLQVLQEPLVIGAAGLMYAVQFFTDKVPGVDSGWDALHTFIRIPAGAFLASGAVGDAGPAVEAVAGLLGGTMATVSHLTKASSRLLINTSPEPFSNWAASLGEDLLVLAGLWIMLVYPLLFLILMVLFLALVIWLLPKIWRLARTALRKLGVRLGLATESPPIPPDSATSAAPASAELPSGLPPGGERP